MYSVLCFERVTIDDMSTPDLVTQRWDQEYRTGRYEGEGPVPFVGEILATLEANSLKDGDGVYVGCGNGRNYIPLTDAGLNIIGLDISPEALHQIEDQRPTMAGKLACVDFLNYQPTAPLDYVISIQVFQHGKQEEVAKHFSKSASILKPAGLLFLRVNSTATQIFHDYKVLETNPEGGKTIEYTGGPKAGMSIHFYTKEELTHLTDGLFEPVSALKEAVMGRKPPQTGQWVQWEGILRKSA